MKKFTAFDISKMIANPCYAGVGKFQATMSDDKWIAAATRAAREGGAEFCANVEANLIEFLGTPKEKASEIRFDLQKRCDTARNDEDRASALRQLLADLRGM